jgi:type VI secretion system protein ImpH
MASADGRTSAGVNRTLLDSPYQFDFFQAVRLLEYRRRERRGGPDPTSSPVGHDDVATEPVRFRAQVSLSFPAASISELREAPARRGDAPSPAPVPPEMTVTFFGLTGPSGVLPRHYTELLVQRVRQKDSSLRDFFDIFNHRLIALFYRAWEKYRLPIGYERSCLDDPAHHPDIVTLGLYCLIGLGTAGLRHRLDLDDETFVFYSGHFTHYPRSASALEHALADYLEMPVRVQQCQGQWLTLEPDDQALMPTARYPLGRNNQLGVDLVVGSRVWDVQSKFRLRIGRLSWREFQALMPNGTALRPLCQFTRTYVGPELDFDIQPVLRFDEVPHTQLSPDPEDGPFLGWNTWMPSETRDHDVDDAVFVLDDV